MTTPTGPDHDRWQDASGAYVLGALEPDEAAAYARHLDACPACRAEVEDLGAVARALPSAAAPVAVPEAVGARVMAQVRREAAAARADEHAAPGRERRPWRAWLRWPAPLLAAATLLVGVVVGLAAAGAFDGDQTTSVKVSAVGAARGAQGRLVLGGDRATLELTGLPAPAGGRVYEVWLQPHGGEPRPTRSLFLPRSDGRATVAVPAAAKSMQAVLVTAEPRGGSSAPTSAPVLRATIT